MRMPLLDLRMLSVHAKSYDAHFLVLNNFPLSPDLLAWRADLTKPAGPLNGLARATQTRINRIVPEKVHAAITAAIEGMTRATRVGSDFTFSFLLPLREKVARSAG